MRSFFSNFIVRLLVIHLIAFWLFVWAAQTFAFLHDYTFLFMTAEHITRLNFPERYKADLMIVEQAGNIGLLIAYVISWFVSNKKNWHWINSLTIFLVLFILKNFLLNTFANNIFLVRGGPFKIYTFWGHILFGTALVALGLILFLSKRIIRFIDPANKTKKKAAVTHKTAGKVKVRGAK